MTTPHLGGAGVLDGEDIFFRQRQGFVQSPAALNKKKQPGNLDLLEGHAISKAFFFLAAGSIHRLRDPSIA